MKKFLFSNATLKVFALALALVAWTSVKLQISKGTSTQSGGTIYKQVLPNVPIYVMQSPMDTNVYDLMPMEASVEVSGSRMNVENIRPESITLYVSVGNSEVMKANLTENTNMVEMVKMIQCKLPPELTLMSIVPPSVRLLTRPLSETNTALPPPVKLNTGGSES